LPSFSDTGLDSNPAVSSPILSPGPWCADRQRHETASDELQSIIVRVPAVLSFTDAGQRFVERPQARAGKGPEPGESTGSRPRHLLRTDLYVDMVPGVALTLDRFRAVSLRLFDQRRPASESPMPLCQGSQLVAVPTPPRIDGCAVSEIGEETGMVRRWPANSAGGLKYFSRRCQSTS